MHRKCPVHSITSCNPPLKRSSTIQLRIIFNFSRAHRISTPCADHASTVADSADPRWCCVPPAQPSWGRALGG